MKGLNMQVSPIQCNNTQSAKSLNFRHRAKITPSFRTYNGSFENIQNINIQSWGERNKITSNFDNLMTAIKLGDMFKKTEGFEKLFSSYNENGLKGLLYLLGQPDGDMLKQVQKGSFDNYGDRLLATLPDKSKYLSIKNHGPWGFWNNLLNRKTKNEIVLKFVNNEQNKPYSSIAYGLDKKDDYRIATSGNYNTTVTFYSCKDGIKEVEEPKVDLYLPPGL